MFSQFVLAEFGFLESEYGFRRAKMSDRCVQYERLGVFIRVDQSRMDEVGITVGLLSHGVEKSFGLGSVIALVDPVQGFAHRNRFASTPDQIKSALTPLAELLRSYGTRVMNCELPAFDDLKLVVDAYWRNHSDTQIRHKAEMAFSARDYKEALANYQELGDRLIPLDRKKKAFCERQLGRIK